MFCRVVSDSENESFIDFLNNNVHLLVEQSASVNLSSETVVDGVPAVDTSTIVFSSNIESDSLTLPAMSDSNERRQALKSDFKSLYADFQIAGNSL